MVSFFEMPNSQRHERYRSNFLLNKPIKVQSPHHRGGDSAAAVEAWARLGDPHFDVYGGASLKCSKAKLYSGVVALQR